VSAKNLLLYDRVLSSRRVNTVWTVLWTAMLVLLPITSFPWVVHLVHSDTVAAPSGLFLLTLVITWLTPVVLRGARLPRQCLPLLALVLCAILGVLVANLSFLPAYKGLSPVREELEAILTLLVGVCFFIVASTWPASENRLRWAMVLINLSGLAIIVWSLAQSGAWYAYHRYPQWLRSIQEFFSVGPLYRQRTAGFTLEPSWLAHQLNMLYLPFWLAATVRGYSAQRKLWRISLENVLLILGTLVLVLTLSRVGLLAFLLTIGYLLIGATLELTRWIQRKIGQGSLPFAARLQRHPHLVRAIIFAGVMVVYALGLVGVGFVLSKVDPRMKDIFNFSFGVDGLLLYARKLDFATRMVYWQTGWNIFNLSPWIGVGLGNAGFYFPTSLPAFAWKLVEVQGLVNRSTVLMNIKSIWVRLLAETGIVGFSLFCTWVILVWLSARKAAVSETPLLRTLGLGGQFVVIALLLEGFSIDSFALPYVWISTGLVTAAAGICSIRTSLPAGDTLSSQVSFIETIKE
jgi:hypothetical protein